MSMVTAATATAAVGEEDCEEDDWELCNDDGFVYKRKRRPLDHQRLVAAAPPEDPLVGEKLRRNRRRMTLLKLQDKYQREAARWEHISNILHAVEGGAEAPQTTEIGALEVVNGEEEPLDSREDPCGSLIDELMVQADVEEALIEEVSSLCEMAEAICEQEEERFRRSLLELPVWESTPREIMLALCQED